MDALREQGLERKRRRILSCRFVEALKTLYAYFSFAFVHPLLEKGDKRQLEDVSAMELLPEDESIKESTCTFQRIYNNLRNRLGEDRSKRTNLVVCSLILQHWKRLVRHLGWTVLDSSVRIIAPVFLRFFLIWLEDYKNDNESFSMGWFWGMIICLCPVILTFIHHRFFWLGSKIGYDMKMSMTAMVHSKLMKLNSSTVSKITTGHVVNLVSNDVQRFERAATFWVYILFGPIETLAALLMVSYVLGVIPTISGFSCIFVLIPLQSILSKHVAQYRKKIADISDERISFLSELISGSLTVKMLALEDPMIEKVNSVRQKEHNLLERMGYVLGSCNAFYGYVQALMVTITFIVVSIRFPILSFRIVSFEQYRYTRGDFSAPDVFFAIGLFSLPRLSMAYYFLIAVQSLSEMLVSTRRLDALFKLSESTSANKNELESAETGEIILRNGQFGWYQPTQQPDARNKSSCWKSFRKVRRQQDSIPPRLIQTLSDISLSIQAGELIGIAGRVGTGKSSLLSALLNEMESLSSSSSSSTPYLHASGTVAYSAQVPWILEGNVRDNITFGNAFNAELYNQVATSCALDVDFEQFPKSDGTELGERGINLSGGQKARISLARAAYSEASINLLDDPLSAVDPKVAKLLFERCIGNEEGIMKNSTRLLVTHQGQFLPRCDRIVIMNNSRIDCVGTWNQVCGHELLDVLHDETTVDELDLNLKSNHHHHHQNEEGTDVSSMRHQQSRGGESSDTMTGDFQCQEKCLVQEEHRELGEVASSIYWKYLVHTGLFSMILAILLLVVGKAFSLYAQLWVAEWASASDYKSLRWVWVLIFTTFGNILTTSISSFFSFAFLIRGSSSIHNLMTEKVLHAPLRFFHVNPSGRILNRFSKDIGMQDDELPVIVNEILRDLTQVLGTIVLICLALPYIVLIFPIVVYIFIKIRRRYVMTSREIKRYDGVTRSPVYAMFSSNIKGLSTIRAFGRQEDFHKAFLKALELNGSWSRAFLATSRWVAFRMDCISSLLFVMTVALAVMLSNKVSEEMLGLALTYILDIAVDVQWFTRQTAELENAMTSVERNLEYTKLEQEASNNCKKGVPNLDVWPVEGRIEYRSVTASYRPGLEPVLKDLSFAIPGGSSVGIVGRTGCGKSSLLLTLFKLIDVNEGQISIDGVDVSALSIDTLRQNLAIIPQDPTLFKGTLRFNLDPYNRFSDALIWKVLEKVDLANVVTTLGGLKVTINEGGNNLSLGQRQLFCLARAILLESKILALDEATANVDHSTDASIQHSIRALMHQKNKTVLIIAHRIDTIMDCDYILVLENGMKFEFGSPSELLSRPGSRFRSVVDAARHSTKCFH